MDVDLGTGAARDPARELVQLLVPHERRDLRQPGMPEVVRSALVRRDIRLFTRPLEPAVEAAVVHPVRHIRLVLALVVIMVVWNIPAVETGLLFGLHPERHARILDILEFPAQRVLGHPLPDRSARTDQLVGAVRRVFQPFQTDEVTFLVGGEVRDVQGQDLAGPSGDLVHDHQERPVAGAVEGLEEPFALLLREQVLSGDRRFLFPDCEELRFLRLLVATVLDAVELLDRGLELDLGRFRVVTAVDTGQHLAEFFFGGAPHAELVRRELLKHRLPGLGEPFLLDLADALGSAVVHEVADGLYIVGMDRAVFDTLECPIDIDVLLS